MITPTYFNQNDSKWGKLPYSSIGDPTQTISSSGCGPTSAALVISTLRNNGVTPIDTCNWAKNHGYRTASQGTSWSYFVPQLSVYNIAAHMSYNEKETEEALKNNKLVIGRAKKGLWTSGGHYILAYYLEGNTIYVNDPNSTKLAKAKADISHWRNEVTPFWIVDEEIDDMTQDKFNEMFMIAMNNYRKSLQDNDASVWSKDSRDWAIEKGLLVGNSTASDGNPNMMWEDFITREQIAALFKRYYEKIDK